MKSSMRDPLTSVLLSNRNYGDGDCNGTTPLEKLAQYWGPLLTAVAALVSVMITWATLSSQLKQREDDRLFTVMNNATDVERPALRAASAIQLQRLALENKEYWRSAATQLVSTLQVDDDPVVLLRSRESLLSITSHDECSITLKLIGEASQYNRQQTALSVAAMLASDPPLGEESISNILGIPLEAVRSFAVNSTGFRYQLEDVDKNWSAHRRRTDNLLWTLESLLTRHAGSIPTVTRRDRFLAGSFLVNARLERLKLSNFNFQGAMLHSAALEGTDLSSCDLRNAKLGGARIDEETNLKNTAWWEADFWDYSQEQAVDTALLVRLFRKYGAFVPNDAAKLHPSVAFYLKTP